MVIRNKPVELQNVALKEVFDKVESTLFEATKTIKPEIFLNFKVPVVKSNPYYLENILQNLITNSVKFQSTERKLSIKIKTEKISNDRTLLMYSDNGIGIDMDRHRNKIFGMYQRFHETGEGKGIGLFLIKSQITALGGSVEVQSELNEGTTFLITL
jgi:signal transduction histidine kinase